MNILRLFSLLLFFISQISSGLPIGFNTTQGGLDYYELKSKNFYIYHDKRVPHEASMMLNSLEKAKPFYEKWFGIKRSSPLPVNMSAVTENASFANFLTDSIELQTLGLGTRDLVFHEYVHSTMYLHFKNWLGPAGSILHLLWMPSWAVEGLAESISVSIGSDLQAGVERYHALSGNWPTFESLHALYDGSSFAFRGYATSGAFMAYILRTTDAEKLPEFLNNFYHYSMPWWWPWSMLPLKNNMPMDKALVKLSHINSRQFYEKYKKDATVYWKNFSLGRFFVKDSAPKASFGALSSLQVRNNELYKVNYVNGEFKESKVVFNEKWGIKSTPLFDIPNNIYTYGRIISKDYNLYVIDNTDLKRVQGTIIKVHDNTANVDFNLLKTSGIIRDLYETSKYIIFKEDEQEITRLCFFPKQYIYYKKEISKKLTTCPFETRLPYSFNILGFNGGDIWIRKTEQTLYGDIYKIIIWAPDKPETKTFSLKEKGRPISMAVAKDKIWMLIGEKNKRSIRHINNKGDCLGVFYIADTPLSIYGFLDGSIAATLFNGNDRAIIKLSPQDLKEAPCYIASEHISPILYAINYPSHNTFSEALKGASLWTEFTPENNEHINFNLEKALPLDKDIKKDTLIDNKSKPAKWRARPIFAVPWIGEDAFGTELAVLSVPLMDHMQNETLRLYVGAGLESRFPHLELNFNTTRFWPSIDFDIFRYQTWNGRYVDSDKYLKNSYLDERGVKLAANYKLASLNSILNIGIKSSYLLKYIGPPSVRTGQLNEPFINISYYNDLFLFNWTSFISIKLAPSFLNKKFNYNVLGFGSSVARNFDFLSSGLSLGIELSRTRGTYTRNLKEVYRPLKVYVPGSGGGINNIHIPIYGDEYLFSPLFGDNQFRSKLAWTIPIIKNFDTLIRLFYLDRLDFTSFINYGGAWKGAYHLNKNDLIGAHGYNLDLQFDIKGVNFNLGLGIGQVFAKPWDFYGSFSFDAIF